MQDWMIDTIVWLFCLWLTYFILESVRHDKISRMFHDTPWYPGKYIVRSIIYLIKKRDKKMKIILMAIGLMALSLALFSVLDLYLESQIEMVNGTVTDKCRYFEPGDILTNSSDPLAWIEVDGKKYYHKEVELEGIGDFGSSLFDDYEKGDHIERELMPYRPYSIWYDTPTFMIFIWMPYIMGMALMVFWIRIR